MRRETAREVDEAAAQWVARIDRAPLSPTDEEQLEAWLDGDTRRRGAFMRLRAVALHSERAKALGPTYDPAEFGAERASPQKGIVPLPAVSWRRFLWRAGGSAIAACAAGLIAFATIPRATAYESALGQVRVVTLEDGSVLTLNTDSEVHVRYTNGRRLIHLDHGEVLFDVAKNKARPFIVEADGTSVTAVGTSFVVRKLDAAPVEVLVREGVVEVQRKAATSPVRMSANSKLISSSTPAAIAPTRIAAEEVTRETAWESGRIAFEGETLEDAAQAFERYSETRIIIEDPSIGREEITGLFASNDPVGFARAAALSLDLKARVGPNEVRLSRN